MGNASSPCQAGRKGSVGGRQSAGMEGKAFLTEEAAYKNLQDYYNKNGSKLVINQLFKEDPDRFKKYRYVLALFIFRERESKRVKVVGVSCA